MSTSSSMSGHPGRRAPRRGSLLAFTRTADRSDEAKSLQESRSYVTGLQSTRRRNNPLVMGSATPRCSAETTGYRTRGGPRRRSVVGRSARGGTRTPVGCCRGRTTSRSTPASVSVLTTSVSWRVRSPGGAQRRVRRASCAGPVPRVERGMCAAGRTHQCGQQVDTRRRARARSEIPQITGNVGQAVMVRLERDGEAVIRPGPDPTATTGTDIEVLDGRDPGPAAGRSRPWSGFCRPRSGSRRPTAGSAPPTLSRRLCVVGRRGGGVRW
jgi:hypothetical protein